MMIYARSTTFSIKCILGKIKFPVFSLIFLLIFKFPVFSLILNKIFKFPDFSLQGIFFSHFPCFPCFSLSVGTLQYAQIIITVAFLTCQLLVVLAELLNDMVSCTSTTVKESGYHSVCKNIYRYNNVIASFVIFRYDEANCYMQ